MKFIPTCILAFTIYFLIVGGACFAVLFIFHVYLPVVFGWNQIIVCPIITGIISGIFGIKRLLKKHPRSITKKQ